MKKDKPEAPASPADKYAAFLKEHLCTFQTAGRRCQMLGGHIDNDSEYRLCSWHWLNQSTPNLLQDYDEFVRYRNMDRETYPKEWLQASLYVDDAIVWACILGKEQRKEFVRALRVVENECDKEVFGEKGRGVISGHPPNSRSIYTRICRKTSFLNYLNEEDLNRSSHKQKRLLSERQTS